MQKLFTYLSGFGSNTGESAESIKTIAMEYKTKLKQIFQKIGDTIKNCSISAAYEVAPEIVKAKKPFDNEVLSKICAIQISKQLNEIKIA